LASGACTITNRLNTAPFIVGVDFNDNNTAAVTVGVTCTSGSVVTAKSLASEADPARFTVNGFADAASTTCTATESSVPAGYASSQTCSASVAAGTCTITNTLEPVIEVKGAEAIRLVSSVRPRALVAGEILRLSGRAPAGCDAVLRIDGKRQGRVATGPNGQFEIEYRTTDLAAGRHLAEVVCVGRGVLLSKVFWVATPVGSSSIVLVVFASLLVLFAIAFVGLRTLAGTWAATEADQRAGGGR
jgi:hypothetical protein